MTANPPTPFAKGWDIVMVGNYCEFGRGHAAADAEKSLLSVVGRGGLLNEDAVDGQAISEAAIEGLGVEFSQLLVIGVREIDDDDIKFTGQFLQE